MHVRGQANAIKSHEQNPRDPIAAQVALACPNRSAMTASWSITAAANATEVSVTEEAAVDDSVELVTLVAELEVATVVRVVRAVLRQAQQCCTQYCPPLHRSSRSDSLSSSRCGKL